MTVFAGIKQPKVIYETSTKYNNQIQVLDTGKIYKLVIDGHVQSVSKDSVSAQKLVWGSAIKILQENLEEVSNVLVLGLGGATMQHLLAKAFEGVNIYSIEIDQEIVDVSTKYFNAGEIPNHQVLVEDALRVVVFPHEYGLSFNMFDAIIVDIFEGDEYPDLGDTGNFLAHLKKLAVVDGIVVVNRVYKEHVQDEVDNFVEAFDVYFDQVDTDAVAGKTNADHMLVWGRA